MKHFLIILSILLALISCNKNFLRKPQNLKTTETCPGGKIKFTLIKAQFSNDYDKLGVHDPQATVKIGSTTKNTSVKGGVKNPKWNKTFDFDIGNEAVLIFTDKDSGFHGKDDKMGSCTIDLAKYCPTGIKEPLISNTVPVGKPVEITLTPTSNTSEKKSTETFKEDKNENDTSYTLYHTDHITTKETITAERKKTTLESKIRNTEKLVTKMVKEDTCKITGGKMPGSSDMATFKIECSC